MVIKKVVTNLLNSDDDFDVIEAPQNNTLYIDQFTDDAPDSDEDRKGFKPKNMKDVFEHYQPKKMDIVLEAEDGLAVYEDFYFNSVKDFEDKQLIEQSQLLSKQKAKIDVYNTLIRRIQSLSDSTSPAQCKKNEIELKQWVELFEHEGKDVHEILSSFTRVRDKVKNCLRDNLYTVHNEVRKLEITYRTLDSFYANHGRENTSALTLMNVDKCALGWHSPDTIAVNEELERYYERLSLRSNYSLLVIPGYLGDAGTIWMWANVAYRNKVIMLTDFKDNLCFEMLKEELNDACLSRQDIQCANIVMTCNYILGRKKSELADEEDDIYLPGSAALAGRMTSSATAISIGAAGKKHGTLSEVLGVRIGLRNSEILTLIDYGLIPMIEDDGDVMAFSTKTLYNGIIKGLQEYPTIRVFNWISKVIQNYVDEEAFVNWDAQLIRELRDKIFNFLNDYKGAGNLIESYKLTKLDYNAITKDLFIQIELKLFFLQKPYLLELLLHNYNSIWEIDQKINHQ